MQDVPSWPIISNSCGLTGLVLGLGHEQQLMWPLQKPISSSCSKRFHLSVPGVESKDKGWATSVLSFGLERGYSFPGRLADCSSGADGVRLHIALWFPHI